MTDDLVAKLRDEDSYYRLQEKHWCIDAEELERQRLAAADRIEALAAQLAEARAENERLREALRVYAGPMEWTQEGGWGAFPVWADGYPGGVYVDDNTLDYGDAARAALEQGEVK